MAKKNSKFNRMSLKIKYNILMTIPWIIIVMMVLLTGIVYTLDRIGGNLCLITTVILIVLYSIFYIFFRPSLMVDIVDYSNDYSRVQGYLLSEMSVPYILADKKGRILWHNKIISRLAEKKLVNMNISSIIPEISNEAFPEAGMITEVNIKYKEREYKVEIKCVDAPNLSGNISAEYGKDETIYAIFMFDETEINRYVKQIRDEGFVVALVYVDNYEEVIENIEDDRKAILSGLIDRNVTQFFAKGSPIVRKLEKDKYLAVFRYKYLETLKSAKFSLIEDIKSVHPEKSDIYATLSIGVGTGAGTYSGNYDLAKTAMDLALGRGGDQVVVKEADKTIYYGGKSQQQEKNTRVKVRVKAHALRQILDTTDNVLIMGHKMADIDSFGSAIGIFAICRKLEKSAHIVINDKTTSVKPFIDKFEDNSDYPSDMFLLREDAMEYVGSKTAIIVVDVNTAERTECPELLENCKTILVFDHHRQSSEPISNVILSYVDPNASSASEMITEMIQYVDDNIKIKSIEADALYAGINIDTDGFQSKAGPRTFEAVAFLRRHGADMTRVRKMLRNDMEEYVAIADAVSHAAVYKDAFAISSFDGEGLSSPTIGCAKAANQLLDISGVKASFVVTNYNNVIYVSARSIDEINVQLIMEKLGGGGHMTIAGTQFKDSTEEEAIRAIKRTLDQMISEGDIDV